MVTKVIMYAVFCSSTPLILWKVVPPGDISLLSQVLISVAVAILTGASLALAEEILSKE